MKNYTTRNFGVYEAKIRTERGIMSSLLFYNTGDDLPYEVHAKFRVNGRDYFYLRSSQNNSWLLDESRNRELFAEIRKDWQLRCRDFWERFLPPQRIIADRGSLLIRVGSTHILLPNGIGDGEFSLTVCGELSAEEATRLYRFGYHEVGCFEGALRIESDDCGTGETIYHGLGVIALFRDKHGNFAVVELP